MQFFIIEHYTSDSEWGIVANSAEEAFTVWANCVENPSVLADSVAMRAMSPSEQKEAETQIANFSASLKERASAGIDLWYGTISRQPHIKFAR